MLAARAADRSRRPVADAGNPDEYAALRHRPTDASVQAPGALPRDRRHSCRRGTRQCARRHRPAPLRPFRGGSARAGLPEPFGLRLRHTLERLGPTFVKLGQVASTRSDVIPDDVIDELRKLQDDVAPFPDERGVRAHRDRARRLPRELFPSSTAHRSHRRRSARCTARCFPTARAVVVKVQRPERRARGRGRPRHPDHAGALRREHSELGRALRRRRDHRRVRRGGPRRTRLPGRGRQRRAPRRAVRRRRDRLLPAGLLGVHDQPRCSRSSASRACR